MCNIGASSMSPHELFTCWAREVDKAADMADFMCGMSEIEKHYVIISILGPIPD